MQQNGADEHGGPVIAVVLATWWTGRCPSLGTIRVGSGKPVSVGRFLLRR